MHDHRGARDEEMHVYGYDDYGYAGAAPQNRNARIVSTERGDGRLVTETRYRDSGSMTVRASTDVRGDVTSMTIVTSGGRPIRFNGHEARTIYRTLHRHYGEAGLSRGD